MSSFFKSHRRAALILTVVVLGSCVLWFLRSWFRGEPRPAVAVTEPASVPLDRDLRLPPPPAAVPDQQAPIRADIRSALDPATPAALRMELIRALPDDLTEVELQALVREVLTPPAPNVSEAWHSSFIHELCTSLQRLPSSHDLLAHALATVAANRAFPVVHRDYAFQHLRILWRNSLDPLAPGLEQPRTLAIEQTFRQLLTDRPETAAQCILGLHELRHENGLPAVPDQKINQLVVEVLSSADPAGTTSLPARMTAIRIMAERKLPDAGDILKSIARDPQEHALVRTSAIGAIGHAARPGDSEFLKSLDSDNPLIADALRHALNQFQP